MKNKIIKILKKSLSFITLIKVFLNECKLIISAMIESMKKGK